LNLPKSLVDHVSINTSSSDVEVLDHVSTIDSSDPPKSLKMLVLFIILLTLFLFGHKKHLNLQVLMLVFHLTLVGLDQNFLLWKKC
jgi:hypothetical protein